MTRRVAILISGGGSNMVALARSMTGPHPARPCLVVSNVPGAKGLQRATELGIATAVVDHRAFGPDRVAFETVVQERLVDYKIDLICLAGFMRVLTPQFVQAWDSRILNIHPSLLPKYKGLNTHARALAAGDVWAGCSVHEVTVELDGGPILGQATVPIFEGDTPEKLAARILPWEHRLYPEVLRHFAGGDRTPIHLTAGR